MFLVANPLVLLAAGAATTIITKQHAIRRAYARAFVGRSTRRTMGTLEGLDAANCAESDDEDEDVDAPEPAADPAAADDPDAPVNLPAPRSARRKKPIFRICVGSLVVTGRAAEVAQRAKLMFGSNPMTDYNRVAVRRWIQKELRDTHKNLRTADLLKWLPIMELYVFYKTDADVEMEETIAELTAMGRIRGGVA